MECIRNEDLSSIPVCLFKWFLPPFKRHIYLFIFGCSGSSMLHMLFSSCGQWGLLCSCSVQASHCGGFFLQNTGSRACRLQYLQIWGSRTQLSSCGTQAQVLCSTWDLFGQRIEHVSPALAGGFFTTEPSGKPLTSFFMKSISLFISLVNVAQSCLTLCNHMDCSLPGSSVHGILQARILKQVAILFSRGPS